jgi:hypothetical protein
MFFRTTIPSASNWRRFWVSVFFRNPPSELTEFDRTKPHNTEDLKFPFAVEQDLGSQSGTPDVS